MKTIGMICDNCNAAMTLEHHGAYSRIVCPYCGNGKRVIIESDKVKIAQINADTERMGMEYAHRELQDRMEEMRILRRIRIKVICVVGFIVLVLIWVYLR